MFTPRGPYSDWVIRRLLHGSDLPLATPQPGHGLTDDLQLALYLSYELHYNDLAGVPDTMEWDLELLRVRRMLEDSFAAALYDAVGPPAADGAVREVITDLIEADSGPSVSLHMEQRGTLAEMREFVIHRSPYQLKEADPHTFAIPRLHGRPKQLLAQIQAGEYGADALGREMHSTLFAQTMRALGLVDQRNAYLDALPATSLMVSNLISMFGLNRRWRGALVGHLAVFEMTSVTPMTRYSRALERMGAPTSARRFYDVHILADAEHELLALDMADTFAHDEPDRARDVTFGARAVIAVEGWFAGALFDRWQRARAPQVPHMAA